MKNTTLKKRVSGIALSFVLFIGFASGTATAVHAEPVEKTIAGFDTSVISNPEAPEAPEEYRNNWKGSYVYFGTYNGEPVKYRVLDNSTSDFGGTTMLLDCDNILYPVAFDKYDGGTNLWGTCQLRSELNSTFLENSFSKTEQSAIAESRKANPGSQDNSIKYASFAPLTGEKIFILDAMEVANTTYGYGNGNDNKNQIRTKTGTLRSWWLRSPLTNSGRTDSAAVVGQFTAGKITANLVYEKSPGVSPALNIDLPKILFLSVVEEATGDTGASYKMTLSDSNKEIRITGGKSVTFDTEDGTITVPYTYTDGATEDAEKVNRISYMITDKPYTQSNVRVLSYGALQNIKNADGESSSAADAAAGTGTFTLSDDLKRKTLGTDYHLYIIAEHVNETAATDYAGSPVEITAFSPAHHHTWVYTASGNEVKAGCVNTVNAEACSYQGKNVLTVSVAAEDASYSGAPYQKAKKTDTVSSVTGAVVSDIRYYSVSEQGAESALTGAPVDVGKYKAKVTVTDNGNTYTAEKAFRINKMSITPTVSITGWTYGMKNNEPSVTGNTGNGAVTYTYKVKGASDSTYTETVPVNAGEYTVRASVAETENYLAGSSTTDFTISRAAVTVSGITANNKTYDGSTAATLDYSGVTFAGKLDEDVLTVTAEGYFADANADESKTVALKNITLGGTDKDNYVLAEAGNQDSAVADIEKRDIDAVLTVIKKEYDGNTDAQIDAAVHTEDLIPGDSIIISGLKGNFETADAGNNKKVVIDSDSKSITGTGSGNYNVRIPDYAEGTISKISLTVTAKKNTITYGDVPA
ncbi:MAG: YDG domain-containing protein, partial [Acetivibrio ethanolgignens]